MTNTNDYAKELLSLKTEIELLKTIIAMAVDQLKHVITSLNVTTSKHVANDMEPTLTPWRQTQPNLISHHLSLTSNMKLLCHHCHQNPCHVSTTILTKAEH